MKCGRLGEFLEGKDISQYACERYMLNSSRSKSSHNSSVINALLRKAKQLNESLGRLLGYLRCGTLKCEHSNESY